MYVCMCVCMYVCMYARGNHWWRIRVRHSSRKESSFPAEMPLIKSVDIGAANRQSTLISGKFVALNLRNTKIKMRANRKILSLSEACIYFLPEYSHIGRVFWIMSTRRLLESYFASSWVLYFLCNPISVNSLHKKIYLFIYFILLASTVTEQWIINKCLIGRGATTAVS